MNKEIVMHNDVKIEKVSTDDNVANPLTKALTQSKFEHHLESIGIRYVGDWL